MFDTMPVGFPAASSREATNDVPAANGRNVTAAPVLVTASQLLAGMGIDKGLVELKGMTVSLRGRANGACPPSKVMLNDPHCSIDEKLTKLNAKTPSELYVKRKLSTRTADSISHRITIQTA